MGKRTTKKPLGKPMHHQIRFYYDGRLVEAEVYSPAAAYPFLAELFEEKKASIINTANDVVKDYHIAEDIVQSTLLGVCCTLNSGKLFIIALPHRSLVVRGGYWHHPEIQKKMDRSQLTQWLAGKENPSTVLIEKPVAWLQTIVQNNAYKYYKQQRRYQDFCHNPKNWSLVEDPKCPNPEKLLLEQEQLATLRHYVSLLPDHYRSVIELRYYNGENEPRSFDEIAQQLKRDVSTVTSQATRAVRMLREVMTEKRVEKNGRLVKKRQPRSA